MPEQLTDSEKAQLAQTIEMFEVITQPQPTDYQSLEILKEAYSKLERDDAVMETAKKIASAHQLMGQFSSAILEWESIATKYPDDPDAAKALEEIEKGMLPADDDGQEEIATSIVYSAPTSDAGSTEKPTGLDEGKDSLKRIFVDGGIIQEGDFNDCWPDPDSYPPGQVVPPLVQLLADRGLLEVEAALKLIAEKTKLGYTPLLKYDVDVELSKTFDRDTCKRWCVLPIDKMSKSILVATANPFNQQAAAELEHGKKTRLLYYLAPPEELVKVIGGVFH
jgi:hypothetical protein